MTTEDNTVRFRVPRGDTALPELLRALDGKNIAMTSIQVHRPTLDDVFLTLTGRSLRDAEAAPAVDEEAPRCCVTSRWSSGGTWPSRCATRRGC